MSPSRRAYPVLASAMLVAVALAVTPETLRAQDAMGGAAVRNWERRAAKAEQVRDELSRRIEREQAHAQMPDTMYASTPDPSPPPPRFP